MWSIYRGGQATEGVEAGGLTIFQLSHILHRPYLAVITPNMMHFVIKYTFPKYSNNSIDIVCTNLSLH